MGEAGIGEPRFDVPRAARRALVVGVALSLLGGGVFSGLLAFDPPKVGAGTFAAAIAALSIFGFVYAPVVYLQFLRDSRAANYMTIAAGPLIAISGYVSMAGWYVLVAVHQAAAADWWLCAIVYVGFLVTMIGAVELAFSPRIWLSAVDKGVLDLTAGVFRVGGGRAKANSARRAARPWAIIGVVLALVVSRLLTVVAGKEVKGIFVSLALMAGGAALLAAAWYAMLGFAWGLRRWERDNRTSVRVVAGPAAMEFAVPEGAASSDGAALGPLDGEDAAVPYVPKDKARYLPLRPVIVMAILVVIVTEVVVTVYGNRSHESHTASRIVDTGLVCYSLNQDVTAGQTLRMDMLSPGKMLSSLPENEIRGLMVTSGDVNSFVGKRFKANADKDQPVTKDMFE